MISPELATFKIDKRIRTSIEDHILGSLFQSLKELPPNGKPISGIPVLTVSQAKERLKMVQPSYGAMVSKLFPMDWKDIGYGAADAGNQLHKWIEESSTYFRREGAEVIRTGLTQKNETEFYRHVWGGLFKGKIRELLDSTGILLDEGGIRLADLLIESLKQWTQHLCSHFWGLDSNQFQGNAFFLDTETTLTADITFHNKKLRLKGKPDAVFYDQRTSEIHLWEYKFGQRGALEAHIAQVILYMNLLENVKGCACSTGNLAYFKLLEDQKADPRIINILENRGPNSEFPASVKQAFEGYIGNEHAVHQLKVALALRLGNKLENNAVNFMFCGPGGTGKTELAYRTAKALGTPFLNVPATTLKNADDLIKGIDGVLKQEALEPEQIGMDSGLPLMKYPPVSVFIDEVHALNKRVDAFLNMLEPKERRAMTKSKVCDFREVIFMAATTDKGKLNKPFLTRFRIIDLRQYTLEEMSEILKLLFAKSNIQPPQVVCELLTRIGRFIPRTALERTQEFIEYNSFSSKQYPITEQGIKKTMEALWNVDENGLTLNDRAYLDAVSTGPKGMAALTTILPCGKEEIETVIEPYLVQLGAIRLTKKGKEITEIGRSMLIFKT